MLTTTLIGVAALVIGVWAIWRKKLPKARVWLMLIAGLCSIGLFTQFGHYIAGWIVNETARVFTVAIGGAAGLGIGLFVVLELWHAGHPKKGKPQTFHAPLAFLAPALLAACGGFFTRIATGGAHVVSHLSSLFG